MFACSCNLLLLFHVVKNRKRTKNIKIITVKFIHWLCVYLASKSYVYPRISLSLVC